MILQISTDLKSQELHDKFRWIIIDGPMMKAQVWAFNLDYPMVWATELVQHAKLLEEQQEWDDEVKEAEIVLQSLRHEVSFEVVWLDKESMGGADKETQVWVEEFSLLLQELAVIPDG
jgi:hypothetical protein